MHIMRTLSHLCLARFRTEFFVRVVHKDPRTMGETAWTVAHTCDSGEGLQTYQTTHPSNRNIPSARN
jgi:hypothetical protein